MCLPWKNPELIKLFPRGGRRITLYTDIDLQKWLDKIPTTKRPKGTSEEQCYALMVLLWYSGARPGELMELKKENMYPLLDSKGVYGIALTLRTLKHGEDYRKISIPYNKITQQMYNYVQNSPPDTYYFYNWRAFHLPIKHKWTTHQVIYVREQGKLLPEDSHQQKEKAYLIHSRRTWDYIHTLTGLPPIYFRHHRLSWMAKLGASNTQMKEYKGAKSFNSVTPYLQLGGNVEKDYLAFFPKP